MSTSKASKLLQPALPPASEREVWTAQDVAAFLLVTPQHVTKLAHKKVIPGKQFGTSWRFLRKDIESFR